MRNALWLSLVLCLSVGAVSTLHAQDGSPATRIALAHQLFDSSLAGLGTASQASDAYDWSVRWMRAELEAHLAGAAVAHLERMTTLLARVHAQVQAGAATTATETACQYYVAEARAWTAHPPTP
jgi:hypothetical protein